MERKYRKKSNLVNRTGYTPGYSTEKNPVNFIPSENITMANTPYPLHATPLDQNGNPIGNSVVMQPGEEYRFGGASYVAETPMFGHGGEKNDWISAKISKLVHEGYPQKQAVAIAYEMYDNVHGNGGYQLPMYQAGKKDYNFGNTFAGSNFAKPKFGADPNIQSPADFSASLNKVTEINPGEHGLGKDPNYVNPLSPESLTAGQDFKKKTDEMGKAAGLPQTFSPNVFGAEVEDTKTETTGLPKPDIKADQPFQFFNPYSGVDIPTAGVMFGQSLENKDTLGAIASGAKVALGTARNILGGMGQARRENYVKQQYAEKQREGMTGQGREQMARFGGYYQEGGMQPGMEEGLEGQMSNPQEEGMEQQGAGQEQQIMQEVAQMLEQGADPQQVIQQLVQMGVPQEQAVQMVQAVMQQMQGSTPQLKRGGMMCYEDGGEEDGGEDDEEKQDLINKYPNRSTSYSSDQAAYAEVPKQSTTEQTQEKEEEAPSYDKNSARDTWVAKTGMPWAEAKRLGYTDGSAKGNIKLLSELNDSRFNKKYLRSKPISPAKKTNKTYTQEELWGKAPVNPLMEYFNNSRKENSKKVTKETPQFVNPFFPNNGNPITGSKQFGLPTGAKSVKEPEKKANWEIYRDNISGWLNNNAPVMFQPSAYQDGGDYDTYNEKDFKDNDIVRHSGGNTGLTKSEVHSLAKHYKMSPQDFLNIISYGEPGEGMSTRDKIFIQGSDKQLPINWRETYKAYKQNKPSTTGFRGALNKGLDYIGVEPMFNNGGYYQDGGEQQIAEQVSQALQEGAQPQQVMQMLLKSGMNQDQAVQLVQAIMQQIQQQGGMEEETPQMKRGGEMIKRADGSYSRRGFWDNIRDNRGSGKEPTKEMLEQEAKIKREYQEGGMEPGAAPQQEEQMQAIMQQVAQMLQQGAQPEEILQMLVEAGVPEEQATQMVQAAMQQMQGGQAQQGTPQMKRGGYYQEGGEEMDEQMEGENEGAEGETPSMEQIESQVEEALKQGADPQQVLEQLVQMGIPQEQAMQMIQEILQEIQNGETQPEAPEMKNGGSYLNALKGKTIKDYTFNSKTGKYEVSYE
jgi:transcriptional regulator CtsR